MKVNIAYFLGETKEHDDVTCSLHHHVRWVTYV